MVREVERDLFEMGIRVQSDTMQDKDVHDNKDFETVELQAYPYMLTSWNDVNDMVNYIGNLYWVKAEFMDRVDSKYLNPGNAYKVNESLWNEYLRDDQFAYTYNERIREQLPQLIRELKKRPNSRQAIVTMYDRHQDMNNWGGKDRVPCSMYYQFYIRKGKLNMIYTMRSCDFLNHFTHDVWLALRLLEWVANAIHMESGVFTHMLGSLHAYQKDLKARGIY
jgi:thymidylate synthase